MRTWIERAFEMEATSKKYHNVVRGEEKKLRKVHASIP